MIMLGNLTISEIESRIGIPFPEEIREFMDETHQDEASKIKPGKWHCFDIPFCLVCGDMKTAEKIYYSVKDRASEVKEQLKFSLSQE